MKLLAIAFLLQQAPGFDYERVYGIAVLDRGRPKPLESFARELMHGVTGSAGFRGYRDPQTRQYVEVFAAGDAVGAVLKLIARPPEEVRALRFIRIDHLELKEELGLEVARIYFSVADLESARDRLRSMYAEIQDEDNATVQQRAVLQIVHKHRLIDALCREQLLAIVPVSFGRWRDWPTPSDLRRWLAGSPAGDERFADVKAALDGFVEKDASRRGQLQAVADAYAKLIKAVAEGRVGEFNAAGPELAAALRALNPRIYPRPDVIEAELAYNDLSGAGLEHWLLGIGALVFLAALVFGSSKLGWTGVFLQVGALGVHGYGYALRWIASGQYPLSNHYESMLTMAAGAVVLSLVLELFSRARVFGLGGCIAGWIVLLLADNVYQFHSQSFINPLQPALMNTIWMTIHVPTIMCAYASALLMMVLGHVYLVAHFVKRGEHDLLARYDRYLHRVLQVTVLLLLAGIILGAVWAGEAWGRPWGWDMKEVWALITLLTYLAILHARMAGALKGFGTAAWSIAAFFVVILCYYAVNFLWGKGLHTYGFGVGDTWPLYAYFGIELAFIGACLALRRRRGIDAAPREPAA